MTENDNHMPPKILVTGAAGFIGRSFLNTCIHNEIDVTLYGIDIKPFSCMPENINAHIDYQQLDICNIQEVKTYLNHHQFDGIIHLAAVSRVAVANEKKDLCLQTNYYGTKHIIESLSKKTWVIFASSREVYGEPETFLVKEHDRKKPLNIYGRTKLEAEKLIQEMVDQYIIMRFSNVYGNQFDIPERVIPNFIQKALINQPLVIEGGNQWIDFTHISDTVDSILRAVHLLCNRNDVREVVHVSPGEKNTLFDVIQILETSLNQKLTIDYIEERDYDVVRFIGDPNKRENLLGKKEFKSLEQGLKLLLNKQLSKASEV